MFSCFQDYLGSLKEQVKESFSEGKSGAFLYFTSDGRYIVKTVTRSERTVILKIADNMLSYFEGEVGAGRKAFIATPFGFHSIRMYRTKIYFLVQENVLRVHTGVKHDLKEVRRGETCRATNPKLCYCVCVCVYVCVCVC